MPRRLHLRSRAPEPGSLTWAIEWRHWLWEPAMRKTLSAVADWNGLNVCELGPRSGRLAVYLAGMGARVTGYELDGVDLSDARRTASESGVDELVSFRNYDGDTSSIRETFDIVVTKSVLAAMPAATAVASIRTLVSPGGMYLGAENKQLPGVLNRFRGYPELGFGSSHVADLKAQFADVRIRSTYGLIASIVATA